MMLSVPSDIIFKSLMLFFKSNFAALGGCRKNGDQNEETTRGEARAKMTGPLGSKSVHEASTWVAMTSEWLCTKCHGPPLR